MLEAGRLGGRRRRGAQAGAAVMLAAVLSYYALMVVVRGPSVALYAGAMSAAWSAVGVPLAALFGAAGAVARGGGARWRGTCLALLGGALCGEAVLLAAIHGANPVFALELLAGAACPLATLLPRSSGSQGEGGRGGARWRGTRPGSAGALAGRDLPALALPLTVLLTLAAVLADEALRLLMRSQGWTGP